MARVIITWHDRVTFAALTSPEAWIFAIGRSEVLSHQTGFPGVWGR